MNMHPPVLAALVLEWLEGMLGRITWGRRTRHQLEVAQQHRDIELEIEQNQDALRRAQKQTNRYRRGRRRRK